MRFLAARTSNSSAPMEAVASSWRNLCFKILRKLIGLPPKELSPLVQIPDDELPEAVLMELSPLVQIPDDELPEAVLMDIFAILDIPDLMRVASVCYSWRCAYISMCKLRMDTQAQTPCLVYTCGSPGESVACIYSLVEKRVYKLNLPICRRYLIGSSLGWLTTVDVRCEMHLVNPITGEEIGLPSVITMEHVKPMYDNSGSVCEYEYSRHTVGRVYRSPCIFGPAILRDFIYRKAFVFFDTSTRSYIVVLIHNPQHDLSFARVGDDKWTSIPPHAGYRDCTYKDGILYAVTSMGAIHALDLSSPVVDVKVIIGMDMDIESDNIFIVQAPWGDLLQVRTSLQVFESAHLNPETAVLSTREIKIYRLDTVAEKLVEINCLLDHVLFLGNNQSLCLSAEEHPHLKPNHVYFTDDMDYLPLSKNKRRDIGVFDMEKNSNEELVSPQLWSNWPNPTWIVPSLTNMALTLNN